MEFILIVLVSNLGYAFESISYKYFTKLRKTTFIYGVTLFAFLAFLVISTVFAITDFSAFSAGINYTSLLGIALNACIVIGQMTLWVLALQYVKMSVMDPIINFQLVITAALSWLLFGDSITTPELILLGFILLFCVLLGVDQSKTEQPTAINLTSQPDTSSKNRKKFLIGIVYLCLWMLLGTLKSVVVKYLLVNDVSPITYQTIYYFFSFCFIFVFLLFLYHKKSIRPQLKQQLAVPFHNRWFLVNTVSVVVSGLGYLFLIKNYNIGLIMALMNIYNIIIMLYGKWVFKEKISKLSYLYVSLILIASSVLSYFMATK